MAEATGRGVAVLVSGLLATQFAALGPAPALAQSRPAAVELSSSERHEFRASDGTLYDVSVAWPFSYLPDSGARYPVVYLTDASLHFLTVAQIMRGREMEDSLPPMILVGVDRPSESVLEALARRVLILTPTRNEAREELLAERYEEPVRSGGAEAFLAALTEEIVPWVDARYATADSRVLVGHSLGGLFATHALLSSTDTFTHFLILSPFLAWDDGVIFERERARAETNRALRARVFLAAGSEEDEPTIVPDMQQLAETLNGRQYPGLELEHRVFEGETHMSVIPVAVSRGLTFLFGER